MKKYLATIVLSISLPLMGIWILSSCNKSNFKELMNIPKFEEEMTSEIKKGDIATHFSMQRSFNWARTKVPTDIKVTLFDSKYKELNYYYFLEFNSWFEKLKFENGIMPINSKENLDCDNFAMLYKSLVGISAYKSEEQNEPAVAVLVVEQINEFGGIPATGGLHMVNLVMTNNGWFIFEPQTGKYTLLERYPNQEYIQYFIL